MHRHRAPAITGEKARSGFETSAEGTMVDGGVLSVSQYKLQKLS
jgi:hypothetical protein